MNTRAITALILAAVVTVSALAYYEHTGSSKKGQELTLSTGDSLGFNVTRVVSLDPAATATLYALGAYGDIVGGSAYGSYPPNSTLPVVGEYPQMNLEDIYNLTPQAVIAFDSNYTQSSISKLLDAGINYVFLSAGGGTSLTTVEKQVTFLGQLTGKEANASKVNSWMNSSMSSISSAVSGINSSKELSAFYYLSGGTGGTVYTSGNGTFFNDFFNRAHLKNIAQNVTGGFVPISPEIIANNSPQVIFLDGYVNSSVLTQYPFNESPAVKNGKVYTLPNEDIFTEPSFRNIYAIAWMVQVAYGINVSLPSFPVDLKYSPDPVNVG